jgi:polyisoprenoid-binding protein YceI
MAWIVDPSHTSVEFSVKHLMISTVRGQFRKFEGVINVDEQNPQRCTAEGTVYLDSVDTHDDHRDTHLRSSDFFDVANYPTMTFKSKRIELGHGNHFKAVGDLTIKGVTREIAFDVVNEGQQKDPWGGTRWGFSAATTLNRKDFGLNWNVALEHGGWLVGDQIKVAIELQVVERQPEEALVTA